MDRASAARTSSAPRRAPDAARLSIARRGDDTASDLARAVAAAFRATLAFEIAAPVGSDEDGEPGDRMAAFVNGLVNLAPSPRWLQVGARRAAIVRAAAFRNRGHFLCVDDWSDWPEDGTRVLAALDACRTPEATIDTVDARVVDVAALGPFAIHWHDGPRLRDDRMLGLIAVLPALAPEFVSIVADWNAPVVREAQARAVRAANLDCLHAIDIRSTRDDEDAVGAGGPWRNGYHVGVYARPPVPAWA